MRIATWNVERLVHKRALHEILSACRQVNADILVLTETDERINPGYRYCFQTPKLTEIDPECYRQTENRVSVFTNYECCGNYHTCDRYTALCVELRTEFGNLLVYGSIMGVHGNRRASFKEDVQRQTEDFVRLASTGRPICIAGDYNTSFSDNYYFTNYGRDTLRQSFSENHIRLLTETVPECVDHIAVSESFIKGMDMRIEEWNIDKSLSDHKGIAVTLT